MALTKPFAENGDKTPIELNPQADGSVSYENGFGARYSMPIKAVIDSSGNITKTGGLQIQRAQMNQILYDFSTAIIENQENTGDLSNLQTNAKDNLVNAINEVRNTTPRNVNDLTLTLDANGKFQTFSQILQESQKYKISGQLNVELNSDIQGDINISYINHLIYLRCNNHKIIGDININGASVSISNLNLEGSLFYSRQSLGRLYRGITISSPEVGITASSLSKVFTDVLTGAPATLNITSKNAALLADSGTLMLGRGAILNAINSSVKLEVARGGYIVAVGNQLNGDGANTSQPFNTITRSGIIYG